MSSCCSRAAATPYAQPIVSAAPNAAPTTAPTSVGVAPQTGYGTQPATAVGGVQGTTAPYGVDPYTGAPIAAAPQTPTTYMPQVAPQAATVPMPQVAPQAPTAYMPQASVPAPAAAYPSTVDPYAAAGGATTYATDPYATGGYPSDPYAAAATGAAGIDPYAGAPTPGAPTGGVPAAGGTQGGLPAVGGQTAGGGAIDPATGMAIDPTTGLLVEPTTGVLVDPTTGSVFDPTTGQQLDPNTGAPLDGSAPATGATGGAPDPSMFTGDFTQEDWDRFAALGLGPEELTAIAQGNLTRAELDAGFEQLAIEAGIDPASIPGGAPASGDGWSKEWAAKFKELGFSPTAIEMLKAEGMPEASLQAAYDYFKQHPEEVEALNKQVGNGSTSPDLFQRAIAAATTTMLLGRKFGKAHAPAIRAKLGLPPRAAGAAADAAGDAAAAASRSGGLRGMLGKRAANTTASSLAELGVGPKAKAAASSRGAVMAQGASQRAQALGEAYARRGAGPQSQQLGMRAASTADDASAAARASQTAAGATARRLGDARVAQSRTLQALAPKLGRIEKMSDLATALRTASTKGLTAKEWASLERFVSKPDVRSMLKLKSVADAKNLVAAARSGAEESVVKLIGKRPTGVGYGNHLVKGSKALNAMKEIHPGLKLDTIDDVARLGEQIRKAPVKLQPRLAAQAAEFVRSSEGRRLLNIADDVNPNQVVKAMMNGDDMLRAVGGSTGASAAVAGAKGVSGASASVDDVGKVARQLDGAKIDDVLRRGGGGTPASRLASIDSAARGGSSAASIADDVGKSVGKAAASGADEAGKVSSVLGKAAGGADDAAKGAGMLKGALGTAGKIAGKAAWPLQIALTGVDIFSSWKADGGEFGDETKKAVGRGVGGVGGALAGAAIGTAIFPGVGTVVGGIIGGVAGSSAGDWIGGLFGGDD